MLSVEDVFLLAHRHAGPTLGAPSVGGGAPSQRPFTPQPRSALEKPMRPSKLLPQRGLADPASTVFCDWLVHQAGTAIDVDKS